MTKYLLISMVFVFSFSCIQRGQGALKMKSQNEIRFNHICHKVQNHEHTVEQIKYLLNSGDEYTRYIIFNQSVTNFDMGENLFVLTRNDKEKYFLLISWFDKFTIIRENEHVHHLFHEQEVLKNVICPFMKKGKYPDYYRQRVDYTCSLEQPTINDFDNAIFFSNFVSKKERLMVANLILDIGDKCKHP